MAGYTGVFPVFDLIFKVGADKESLQTVADMETFSMSIDGNVEEWTPMDTKGWVRRLMTGKGFSLSLNGKRNVGDAGNDFVHGKAYATGRDAAGVGAIEFPDGSKLEFDCVINVTNTSTGDSTNVAPLEFELMSDGKPTYTAGASTKSAPTGGTK